MTDKQIKVGNVVAWEDVPSGAMVRWRWDGHGNEFYWKRHRFVASRVGTHDGKWRGPGDDNGSFAPEEPVTIIALDVPADATAEDLQRLAEVFEVRESLTQEGGVSLLKAAAEVPTHRHLWVPADGIDFVPAVCSRVFGDGRALLALSTINHRPRFYVIRIDSTWRDLVEDEHIDSIYDALLEEFGDAEQVEADEPKLEWPAFDGTNGSSWCWLEWFDFAKRLHAAGWRPGMTAEDAARLLAEAG